MNGLTAPPAASDRRLRELPRLNECDHALGAAGRLAQLFARRGQVEQDHEIGAGRPRPGRSCTAAAVAGVAERAKEVAHFDVCSRASRTKTTRRTRIGIVDETPERRQAGRAPTR